MSITYHTTYRREQMDAAKAVTRAPPLAPAGKDGAGHKDKDDSRASGAIAVYILLCDVCNI